MTIGKRIRYNKKKLGVELRKRGRNFNLLERCYMAFTYLVLSNTKVVLEYWPFETAKPSPQTILSNYRKFLKYGHLDDLKGRGRKTTVLTSENEEKIENMLNENDEISLNKLVRSSTLKKRCVQRIIHRLGFSSYKKLKVQKLYNRHFSLRERICKWFIRWNCHNTKRI